MKRLSNYYFPVIAIFLSALIAGAGSVAQDARITDRPAGTVTHAEPLPIVVYDFEVLEKRAQPRENFVQGLEIHGEHLYLSSGGFGESRLREYDFPTMRLLREYELAPDLFAEGITRIGQNVYQLTWLSQVGLVHDLKSFRPKNKWSLDTQGWGITNNGQSIIYSDGSHRLHFLHPDTLKRERTLEVTLQGRALPYLNELEWIDGEIWANVWRSNQLVRIDPADGSVTGIIDLRGLLPDDERREDTDVLNGIAYDPERDAIWVTGKRWPWLYRITLRARAPGE